MASEPFNDASPPESSWRAVLTVALVALCCSALLASVVQFVRPQQRALQDVAEVRNLVLAAGMATVADDLSPEDWVDRFTKLDPRLVDLRTDRYSNDLDPLGYDDEMFTSDQRIQMPPVADIAGLKSIAPYAAIFWYQPKKSERLLILPIEGKGMWSTIRGHIVLRSDLNTIDGLRISEHGETPGIGDRIEDQDWLDQWRGKRVRDEGWRLRVKVGGAIEADDREYTVDAISGATVTADAVSQMVRFWLGDQGYGPFLANQRAQL